MTLTSSLKPKPDSADYAGVEAFLAAVKAHEGAAGAADIDATLTERGSRYGSFVGHAEVSRGFKTLLAQQLDKRGKKLSPDQEEALSMIFHKIGRIVNGDADYADSWVDIAGYAKLVADRLLGTVR